MKKTSLLLVVSTLFISLTNGGCTDAPDEVDPVDSSRPISNLFAAAAELGQVESPELDEASGLAASRSNSLYLWTHNDSGGDAALYLMTRAGADSGKYTLDAAQNVDWEDLAIGPGPDDNLSYLFAADIGDNRAVREQKMIYRVPEPDLNVTDLPETATLSGVETITYVYPDNPKDAETIMVDPTTKDIYIVTKRESLVNVYRLPFPQSTTEVITAEFVRLLPFHNVVAGDISADGSEILIKNYFNVYHWEVAPGQSIGDALEADPSRLNYVAEPQGEAIAWEADGSGYFTLSEEDNGVEAILYRYLRN